MARYEIPALNGTGANEILSEVTSAVPIFVPMLLVFIFFVTFIATYRKQRETSTFTDIPLLATISGVITTVVALILSMGTGLIDMLTLTIVIAATIFFGIWLLASRDR